MSVYFGQFSSLEDVADEFSGSGYYDGGNISKEDILNTLRSAKVLYALYGTPSYEGYGFVLYEKDGKLYEVNGSHCSCYGLEGQWSPEETSWEALKARNFGSYMFEDVEPEAEKTLHHLIMSNVGV
jgi:hypothetical protein